MPISTATTVGKMIIEMRNNSIFLFDSIRWISFVTLDLNRTVIDHFTKMYVIPRISPVRFTVRIELANVVIYGQNEFSANYFCFRTYRR